MYEYKVLTINSTAADLQVNLSSYANTGWRVKEVIPSFSSDSTNYFPKLILERKQGRPLESFKGEPSLEKRTKDV